MKAQFPAALVVAALIANILIWEPRTNEMPSGQRHALSTPSLGRRVSSVWVTETVDTMGDVGYFTSLSLDASDRPHISYVDGTHGTLKYAHLDGTRWVSTTVDTTGLRTWTNTSLVLDTDAWPHISYYDHTSGDLRYAYFDGTNWVTETVDSVGNVGQWNSLALDSIGRPHISYYDDTKYELKYARFDGTSWVTETVDATGYKGTFNSLEIDSADHPHVSYQGTGILRYAYHDGTSWVIETVASDVGACTSLELDTTGRPHIGYSGGARLRYAHFNGAVWTTETVDAAGNSVGYDVSLRLDAVDLPHIAYWEAEDSLKYAHFNGTGWSTETVDATGQVGWYTSLALDTAGQPHISYYDYSNDALKYAYRCTLLDSIAITGPLSLRLGEPGIYSTMYTPLTATHPLIVWGGGETGPTAVYSWTVPGYYTVTVSATNGCSEVGGTLIVQVYPYRVFLPVELKPYFNPTGKIPGRITHFTHP